jgi:palmitoyltransferase
MGENSYRKVDNEIVYNEQYGAFIVLLGMILFLTLFTVCMLIYHSYLVICGMTTWEHAKHHKISYLKVFPRSHNPFDLGVRENVRTTFFHHNRITDWKIVPPKEQSGGERGFNWFTNEYYSCC